MVISLTTACIRWSEKTVLIAACVLLEALVDELLELRRRRSPSLKLPAPPWVFIATMAEVGLGRRVEGARTASAVIVR